MSDSQSTDYSAILEYKLPLDARRPDVIVLLDGPVIVLELKGKATPSQADLDQVAAYARDLRCYHRECHDRPVHAVLIPTRAGPHVSRRDGVYVVGPEGVHDLLRRLRDNGAPSVPPAAFLDSNAYRPLPSLVQAARELFQGHKLRYIQRARASTEPAVETIAQVAHEAARTRTRRLVLVTGVPGSGKTLVGLTAVHARYVDDLAVARDGVKPTSPAIFLSGNGPLVEVLQYQLREAGGTGRTFVRGVKDYLDRYAPDPSGPPEHILVFDEAQRAFSAAMVATKHDWHPDIVKSEPELFVDICDRIPEWCVLVGLVGTGQEIHKGEEEGMEQWVTALAHSPESWTVYAPDIAARLFHARGVSVVENNDLHLRAGLRFHLAAHAQFVESLLAGNSPDVTRAHAEAAMAPDSLNGGGLNLRITRDLTQAKRYLWDRYSNDAAARFGIVVSAKFKNFDRLFAIPIRRKGLGPWYAHDQSQPYSCRRLESAVSEFQCQGLELEMSLLIWGTDYAREGGRWSIRRAGGYRGSVAVKDPYQLRVNAYRVLLTRGRDGMVVFVPPMPELEETWQYLLESGFREIEDRLSEAPRLSSP